jgi:hypothetical protein
VCPTRSPVWWLWFLLKMKLAFSNGDLRSYVTVQWWLNLRCNNVIAMKWNVKIQYMVHWNFGPRLKIHAYFRLREKFQAETLHRCLIFILDYTCYPVRQNTRDLAHFKQTLFRLFIYPLFTLWCSQCKPFHLHCSIMYKWDTLRLTICAYYSWKIALNVELDASLDKMKERGRKLEETDEVNSTKSYVTNDETFRWIFNGCNTTIQNKDSRFRLIWSI